MRPATLELLQCPLTGGPLTLEGDLDHGVLTGEGGSFPVIAGIPVFRSDVHELVELVRAGRHDLAAPP